MKSVIPAMNCLWFWFDKATRRALHGTPEDCKRKYRILEEAGFAQNGVEFFIMPDRIADSPPFGREFSRRYAKSPFKCVHIGHGDADFLDHPEMPGHLDALRGMLEDLDTDAVVLHAHHLKNNRKNRRDLLVAHLPETVVLVENNGFDSPWGSRPENLDGIFTDCPEFSMCLDIAHIWDFNDLSLDEFLLRPVLSTRIREIHWSYSTHRLSYDPYLSMGYPGYGPFHALFSVLDKVPERQVAAFVSGYPVVIEGILPREDSKMNYLDREIQLIQKRG